MASTVFQNDSTSLILNGQPIPDLAEGDFITLTPANPHSEQVNSANGGVAIFKRMDAEVADLLVRVEKYSASDIFLGSTIKTGVTVLNGTLREAFVKNGTPGSSSYALQNGSVTGQPTETRNNQTGNAVMEYTIRFRSAVRTV